MYLLLAIFMVVLIIFLLYHAHVKLNITYKRIENNDIVIILISTGFGMIKYRIELPFLDFVKKMDSFTIRYSLRFKSGKEIYDQLRFKRAESLSEFFNNLDDLIDVYYINKKAINYIAKKIHIKDFNLDMNLGFEDAYITGVSYGITYAVIVNFLAFVKGHINLEIQSVDLKPAFNKDVFDLILSCIIDIKLGHIITGIKMFIKTSRGSEIDGATYSESYENNYGEY